MGKRRNSNSEERGALASLGFGDNAILEMPWYIGAITGEFIALEGEHQVLNVKEKNIDVFVIDTKLTLEYPNIIRLEGGNAIPKTFGGERAMLIAEVVSNGVFKPVIWLPAIGLEGIMIGWLLQQLILSVNIRMIKVIYELERQINKNLNEIYSYFGVLPEGLKVPPNKGMHYLYSLTLKLAIRKKELDQKTIHIGLVKLRECLQNINNAQTRERVVNRLVILENAMRKKSYFEGTYLLPILSETHDPHQDGGLYSGLPYLDQGISKAVLDLLEKMEGFNDDIKEVGEEMTALANDNSNNFPDSAEPKAEELENELNDAKTKYDEILENFESQQRSNEERLLKEVAENCNHGNGIERILTRLTFEIKSLIYRNKIFMKIIRRVLLPNEKEFIRKTQVRISVINDLLNTQMKIISEVVEQEEIFLENGMNPELHAAKFNLLVRLKNIIDLQWDESKFSGSGDLYDPDEGSVPEFLEDFLSLKEFEINRMEEYLENRENHFDETDSQLDSLND